MLRAFCSTSSTPTLPESGVTPIPSTSTGAATDTAPNDDHQDRRKHLLKLLRHNYSGKRQQKSALLMTKQGRPKRKTRVVQFGMRLALSNDDDSKINHQNVKSPLGDKNQIALTVDLNASYEDVLQTVTEALFPGDRNPVIGPRSDFSDFQIVNGHNTNVRSGLSQPFTLPVYVDQHLIPGAIRLFLLIKPAESLLPTSEPAAEKKEASITVTSVEDEDDSDYLPELGGSFTATSPSNEVFIRRNILTRGRQESNNYQRQM
jgi:hypothetical protein